MSFGFTASPVCFAASSVGAFIGQLRGKFVCSSFKKTVGDCCFQSQSFEELFLEIH